MGILLALIALFSWSIGDFLIQRSTRAFGDWIALFYIEAFGVVALLPFVWHELPMIGPHVFFLLAASIVILVAALFNFEAFRIGKLSVIEPIFALEVPVTIALALTVLHEPLTPFQLLLIAVLMFGIFLVSTKTFKHLTHVHLEKGVWFALIGATAMGVTNFLFGVGSRSTSPLLINWFTGVFLALVTLGYLVAQGQGRQIIHGLRREPWLALGMSIFDNIAWIAYSASTVFIPISIATGVSESYIGLAALLGMYFNREKLARHQWFGLTLSVVAVVILATTTK